MKGRPLYTQAGTLVTHRSIGPEQYGRFLIDVFEEWVRRDIGTVYVQMFDTALANWCGEPGGMCVHSTTCGSQFALEHDRDLYSCDHFVEPGFLLGNIGERTMLELVAFAPATEVRPGQVRHAHRVLPRPRRALRLQRGCPKDRFATSPYGEPGQHYLCPGYKRFFHHVDQPMQAMANLLRANRPPAALMRVYASRDARRGQSDPCTCGGGKTWTPCHGTPVTAVEHHH